MGRWRYTGYYGYPERNRRYESWMLLRDLSTRSNLSWCVIAYFNDMMLTTEERGGREQPMSLLQGFSEKVNDRGLQDLGFIGEKFTWERSRGQHNWVQERLDRGLPTQEWCQLFPSAEVRVIEVATSDHLPIFLHLNK